MPLSKRIQGKQYTKLFDELRGRMADKPPIFIVGSPRSGTTLLRHVLDRHPSLSVCGETRFFSEVYKRRWLFGDLANPANRERPLTSKELK